MKLSIYDKDRISLYNEILNECNGDYKYFNDVTHLRPDKSRYYFKKVLDYLAEKGYLDKKSDSIYYIYKTIKPAFELSDYVPYLQSSIARFSKSEQDYDDDLKIKANPHLRIIRVDSDKALATSHKEASRLQRETAMARGYGKVSIGCSFSMYLYN